MEEEQQGSLPFMDVRFIENSMVDYKQKFTRSQRTLIGIYNLILTKYTQVKLSVAQCLTNRAIMISSSKEKQLKELRRIKTVMASNGYPRKFVNKAMTKQIKRQELPDIDKKNRMEPAVK